MLQGCSKKRPDIYFELLQHCLIVEVDENQHNSYEDSCECARINEIVNGIGGKSVVFIRYNPDNIKNNTNIIQISQLDRLKLLVETIKSELVKDYDMFLVKIIQLFYNDDYEETADIGVTLSVTTDDLDSTVTPGNETIVVNYTTTAGNSATMTYQSTIIS